MFSCGFALRRSDRLLGWQTNLITLPVMSSGSSEGASGYHDRFSAGSRDMGDQDELGEGASLVCPPVSMVISC